MRNEKKRIVWDGTLFAISHGRSCFFLLSLLFGEGIKKLFQPALVAFGEGGVFLQHQQGIVCNGDPMGIFREIGASGEIVQTDIVEVCQLYGTGKGKFSFSLFIFAIRMESESFRTVIWVTALSPVNISRTAFPNWANILLATNRNNKRLNNLFFFISKTHIVIVTKMDKRAKHTDCF